LKRLGFLKETQCGGGVLENYRVSSRSNRVVVSRLHTDGVDILFACLRSKCVDAFGKIGGAGVPVAGMRSGR
jgi:hypothetical protein